MSNGSYEPSAANVSFEPIVSFTGGCVYSRMTTPYMCRMGNDDWYRSEEWNSEIEKEFLTRLSRSRTQRDQQLKIQIQILAEHFPGDALGLIDLYNDTRSEKIWDLGVIAASAKAYGTLGETDKALDA